MKKMLKTLMFVSTAAILVVGCDGFDRRTKTETHRETTREVPDDTIESRETIETRTENQPNG